MSGKNITWSDELTTGILWQDFQHAALITHINRLHRAIHDRRAQSELALMLEFLECYIENHFGIEERYMEVFHDPDIRTHARAHQQFRSNLEELKRFDGTGTQLAAESLCYDLYEWVASHILTIDKKLGLLLRDNALR